MSLEPLSLEPRSIEPRSPEVAQIVATELSRRGFLKSAAIVSGGLVIALHLPGCGKPQEAAKMAGSAKLVEANALYGDRKSVV